MTTYHYNEQFERSKREEPHKRKKSERAVEKKLLKQGSKQTIEPYTIIKMTALQKFLRTILVSILTLANPAIANQTQHIEKPDITNPLSPKKPSIPQTKPIIKIGDPSISTTIQKAYPHSTFNIELGKKEDTEHKTEDLHEPDM
ncbi:MAG: hypothetical protein UR28_C0012G0015 [Candidatus Peregrinibacteria bacterium GW2011_GWF2_33_10]|nr:MAG: hypothetical protein UR28_C0012G0015 [Candidatus Peregrinibacteria bacterium GW2011_GWF2_33_10]OGJ44079.1 MAG: hypothetical protein A2263_01600 [Candidatus Peregrinibacteria bacterium RIFOXYA2_FULL_33_21]OGJ45725.1 MAG: hypothetical protein A2272_03895 [Candidatus Peregrinibacteria bacterium RIFOXYA12_FULL_33_12]OGJ51396.1 MAG: hypothetical protein A2307_02505 [Candidatus Peregrinibacteria bacterium RIFOXYB2_FULL_33_20]